MYKQSFFQWFLTLFTSPSTTCAIHHLSTPIDIQQHTLMHFALTPLAPGHVIITSRRSIKRWEDLERCEQEEFWSAAQALQKKFQKYYQCADYLIILQQQPHFFELHVIPTKKSLVDILIEHFESVADKHVYIARLKQRIDNLSVHTYPDKDECPFCRKDILETQSYLQGTHFSVLQDKSPINPAHGLLIPNRHVEHISQLNQEELHELSPSSVTLTMRNRSKFSRFGTTTEISQ